MNEYRVSWHIDVDAESPTEAAKVALQIQRDPESSATIFEVSGPEGDSIHVLTEAEVPEGQLSEAEQAHICALRLRGFAVTIWSPDEVGNANADTLEDLMVERGAHYIESSQ